MKKFIVIWGFLTMPLIAWVPASLWNACGYLWCLTIYPDWLDRFIYSIARQYLSEDMVVAAQQLEFLEVWIASAIILEVFWCTMIFMFKNKFND